MLWLLPIGRLTSDQETKDIGRGMVMERLGNHITLDKITSYLDSNEQDSLREEIIRVVKTLHKQHFDLNLSRQ